MDMLLLQPIYLQGERSIRFYFGIRAAVYTRSIRSIDGSICDRRGVCIYIYIYICVGEDWDDMFYSNKECISFFPCTQGNYGRKGVMARYE